jgi:hypothetical protein
MTSTSKGRRLLQISLKPDFYELVRKHCSALDLPMTVWARELIKRELSISTTKP